MSTPKRRAKKLKHSTRPDLDALSAQDIRFCQHYAEHGNAAEAYRQAKYHNSTSSPQAVWFAAWAKLRNPNVRRYVRDIRQQVADMTSITVPMLAQSFKRQALADRTAIFDRRGKVKPPHKWPAELRSIIAGVEVIPGGKGRPDRYKIRFETSTEARKVLAQWRGMIGKDAVPPGDSSKRVVIEVEGGG